MNKVISQLHYITQDMPNISHTELVKNACTAGVEWVQLRIKNKPHNEWLHIAEQAKNICTQYNVKLIINDNVSIAKAVEADGVHLGKSDMSPLEAHTILGNEFIIGGTANTFEDIHTLVAAQVDYVGLGPYRYTTTKENLSPIIGLEGYKKIILQCVQAQINIPVIAIGGITQEDVTAIMQTNIHGIAVSSAINKAENMQEAVSGFKNKLKYTVFANEVRMKQTQKTNY